MRTAALALVVAIGAYVAWIAAVADDAHPVLADLAGVVCAGALLTMLVAGGGALVRAIRRRRR